MTVQLELGPGELDLMPPPRHPDRIVFGPPGADPYRDRPFIGPQATCACGVQWSGYHPDCWNCGPAATGI